MRKGIYFIIFLFLISIVSAIDVAYYREVNQPSNVTLKCVLEETGLDCPSNFECNWTVFNPNSRLVIDNKAFTNNGAYHNYTLNGSAVNTEGDYTSHYSCSNTTWGLGGSFIIRVNRSGEEDNPILILGIFLIVFVASLVYIYASFQIDEAHFRAKMLLFVGGILNILGGLFMGLVSLTKWFQLYFVLDAIILMNLLILGAIIYFYVAYIIKTWTDLI